MSSSAYNSAVKVAVRERPAKGESTSSVIVYHSLNSNIISVDERPFTFDQVLGPTVSQKQLFEHLIKPLIQKVKQGFNCTALAYGQTGTGKTYSMGLSSFSFEDEHVGVIPRCLSELLTSEYQDENTTMFSAERKIYASFIEIYNEKVYDLLADNSVDPIPARGYKYTGGNRKPLNSIEDCHDLLIQGTKNRHVRPTKLNSQSSRSHAIFSIHLQSKCGDVNKSSCLNLVDLAGSEGVRRTGHQGVAMSEGVHINQGLLCIGKVLQAMTNGSKVVPYRDSVLTSVLQESLNPNSYLTLLACVSPHREDLSETLSTLRFAQNAKQLKHTPQINAIFSEIKRNKTSISCKRSVANISGSLKSGRKNGTYQHSNTFCTPSKIKRLDMNKFNQSEMGLTPKEKQKSQEQARLKTLHKPPNPQLQYPAIETTNNTESLFDGTIDSRASILSLNISTSTTLDAAAACKPTSQFVSYSPVVRKCMAEFESRLDSKMLKMMESLQSATKEQNQRAVMIATSTPFVPTELTQCQNLPTTVRAELKDIMQELFANNSIEDLKPLKKKVISATASPPEQNPKCQLFATSSPIFKVPELPASRPIEHNVCNETDNCVSSSDSLAISEDNCLHSPGAPNQTHRRSRRISERLIQNNVTLCSSLPLTTVTQERRRSKRISLKQMHDERRQKIRLSAHLEAPELEAMDVPRPNIKNIPKTKKEYRKPVAINNSVIAGYFSSEPQSSTTVKKSGVDKHRKAVLELLNTGSIKELQMLPQIGMKTAYQIILQRTLNGKFRNLTQVEKLPIWRGNGWERFAQANILI